MKTARLPQRLAGLLVFLVGGLLSFAAVADNPQPYYYGTNYAAGIDSSIPDVLCDAMRPGLAVNYATYTFTTCFVLSDYPNPVGLNGYLTTDASNKITVQAGSTAHESCPYGQVRLYKNRGPATVLCGGQPMPPKNAGKTCLCGGDPVNVATGNKYEVLTDIAAVGASPLRFVRYYNSYLAPSPLSQLGGVWRSNYDRTLSVTPPALIYSPLYVGVAFGGGASDSNGSCSPLSACGFTVNVPVRGQLTGGFILVHRPEGNAYNFTLNSSNNGWVPDADVNGRLSSILDGGGNVTGYSYLNPDEETETYDTTGKLLTLTNRAGLVQTLAYNTLKQLASVTDSFGRQLQFAYDGNGRLSTLTDPNGNAWSYAYDGNSNLGSVTGPDSKTRNYRYANSSFPNALTSVVDENGVTIDSTTYDSAGRATATVSAGGANQTSFAYTTTTNGEVRTVTDALGQQSTYAITSVLGVARATQITRSAGGTISFSYDASGNLATSTDYNGNSTHFSFDLTRNLETSRTDAYGTARAHTLSTQWSSSFRLPTLITEADANGSSLRTTTYSYDSHGNRLTKTVTDTASTPTQSQSWAWTYNPNGQVLSEDGPRTDISDVTTFAYDSHGNLSSVTSPLGQVTQFTSYNGSGLPLTLVDPNGLSTTLAYDARNRLTTRTTGSEVTAFQYDAAGQLTQVTLPNGNLVSYVYDGAHRLTEIHDKAGNKTVYTLDAAGNHLTEQITDSGGLGSALDFIKRTLGLSKNLPV